MAPEFNRTEQYLDEIARLLALQIRIGYETQREAILSFASVGLKPKRISELLGTTQGTVSVTLSRLKERD